MKHILIMLMHTLLRLVVVLLAPIACLFMHKTDRKTNHYGQYHVVQRYRLPKIFRWMETPDEDLAGGLYEPTVKKIYDKYGVYTCSVYWIGLRNQAQGFLWTFGRKVYSVDYYSKKVYNKQPFPIITWNLYFFTVIFDWEIAHDHYLDYTTTGYYAIPNVSFRRN